VIIAERKRADDARDQAALEAKTAQEADELENATRVLKGFLVPMARAGNPGLTPFWAQLYTRSLQRRYPGLFTPPRWQAWVMQISYYDRWVSLVTDTQQEGTITRTVMLTPERKWLQPDDVPEVGRGLTKRKLARDMLSDRVSVIFDRKHIPFTSFADEFRRIATAHGVTVNF